MYFNSCKITFTLYFSSNHNTEAESLSEDEDIFETSTTEKIKSEKSVVNITGKHCVLHVPHVIVSILIIGKIIFLLCDASELDYVLRCHHLDTVKSHANKSESLWNQEPVVQIWLPKGNQLQPQSARFCSRPCLCYVVPEGSTDSSSADDKILSTHFYNGLFGLNNNLLDAEVLLLGLPNGNVFYKSIRGLSESSTPKMIYDLGEPVIGIHAVHFTEEMSELEEIMGNRTESSACNALILVGRNGKVACISSVKKEKELQFKEVFIPGPVMCSKIAQSKLIFATELELKIVDVSVISKAANNEYLKYQGMGIFFVRTFSVTKAEVGTDIYALCKKGQLLHRQIDLERTDESESFKRQVGGNLKDLLTGMGHVSDDLKVLHEKIERLNVTLSQLAITTALANQQNASGMYIKVTFCFSV